MTGQPDFGAHDSLLLYRDRIREILAEHGMHSPRAAGLAATGRPVPRGVAIELYVDVAGRMTGTPTRRTRSAGSSRT